MIASPLWLLALFYSGDYEYTSALLLIPLVIAFNLIIALRITSRDPFLQLVLPVAILFKVAACGLYIYMVLNILGGGDVGGYFEAGKQQASLYSVTGEWQLPTPFWGTNFITTIAGALLVVVGPSLPTASVIFGLFAFWGEYFSYRAFCTAFPNGDRYLFGILLFFLPSIVFWPATIGKDALIMFFIGLSVFGFALINAEMTPKALVCLGTGLLGTTLVRPHMAAMLAISMTAPYLISANRRGAVAFLRKMLGLAILLTGTYFITSQAETFLRVDDLTGGVKTIENVNNFNRYGPAAFGKDESFFTKSLSAPLLLFRPFIWEAHNIPSALASLESLLLFLLYWRRRRELLTTISGYRIHNFVGFLLLYTVQFSIIFAGAMSNFGLLVRQRVMLLPFVLMLFTASAMTRQPRRRLTLGMLSRRASSEPALGVTAH